MPTKKSEKGEPEPLETKALRIIARKYKLKDALLVDTARDSLRSTGEAIYRFRAVSAADANGPKYDVVLDQSGTELDLDEMNKRDEANYFSIPVAPVTPGVGGAPISAVTISPTENKLELNQGDTSSETITVIIPPKAGVVKADVYFLADTTGSMGDILNAVKAGASNILAALNGLGLDFAYGVGNYKDFPNPPNVAFQHQLNPTNIAADVTAAINAWSAGGGGDGPEGQLFALHKLAEAPGGPIGWRAGSKRIIVWFGDAPGHDPVCAAISGDPADITEASATAKLVAEAITVLAISTSTPGLDDDPKAGGNYIAVCGAPGGSPGQGTRIANATGGTFVTGINPGNIVQTIINLVKGAITGIKNVKLVSSGGTMPFVTSISPATGYGPLAGDKEHTLRFEVTFTGVVRCKDTAQVFTGTLDIVADEKVVAQKRVEITVPACKAEPLFSYSVKFVCGIQPECPCACAPVRPGIYATEINIYNPNTREVPIRKLVIPVVFAGAAAGREPGSVGPKAEDKLILPAHSATIDDCRRLAELLLGAAPANPIPLTIGFLQIISPVELSVTAVYTASGLSAGSASIDVQQIDPRRIQ